MRLDEWQTEAFVEGSGDEDRVSFIEVLEFNVIYVSEHVDPLDRVKGFTREDF